MDVQAPALVTPNFGCGAAPTAAALFNTVAARRSPAPHRSQGRQQARTKRQSPPAPRQADPEPRLSQAYFTCSSTPLIALPVGAGWLAVGPLRRS